MDMTTLRAALAGVVSTATAEALAALARPSIRLVSRRAEEASLVVGSSQLGGSPDLPAALAWPAREGRPLAFVAQIRLADVAPLDAAHLLPGDGLLAFFYDAERQPYGDDPADRDGWQVHLLTAADGALARVSLPPALPPAARFAACTLARSAEVTLPADPRLEAPDWQWRPGEQERYEDYLASFPNPADRALPRHRMLGYADSIQDDMRLQCQLVSHGIAPGADDPRIAALAPGAADWLLLLQVDSDAEAGMRWGSAGRLYFWIERAALAARRFEGIWAVVQSD